MPDVFLSYARRDSADFVRRLTTALEGEGIDVWVDLEDIPAASDWQEDLRDGVLQSDCFCFVVSPTSAVSTYCLGELSDAEARNKRVIPLIHEPVTDADLPRLLQRLNWVPQRGKFEDDFDANLKVLAEAIQTDLEATRAHTRWEAAAAAWEEKDRDASLLPRGSELREAESWIATQMGRDPAPTALQSEFVEAARRASERRRRLIFGATAVALVVSVALGIVALLQRNEARDQRDMARSNELASAAEANLDTDPELSIILGKEAVETVDTPRAEEALAQGISQSLVRLSIKDPGPKPVAAASFSPDDRLIATAGGSGVHLYDAKTGDQVRALTTDTAFDADFTPDGRSVAVATGRGSIDIYATADGSKRSSIDVGRFALFSVDVSPDGKRVAAGGENGVAGSYDIATGKGAVFDGHGDKNVNSVAYSPNSKVVLSVGNDGAARLWYADSAQQIAMLRAPGRPAIPGVDLSLPGAPASDAEFSPDGKSVATANVDGSTSLWSLKTAEPKATPITSAGDGFFTRVAFNGRRNAVIVGGIGRADAFDLDTDSLVATYRGHAGYVNEVSLSSDGSQLVTAGEDGTTRVWDFNQVRFGGTLPILVTDLDLNADGSKLLTGGIPALIDVASAGAQRVPYDAGVAAAAVAFDPADDRVAIAGTNGIVRILDPKTGKAAGPTLDPAGSGVSQVAWSADGSRLMTRDLRDGGGGVTVYDTKTGDEIGAVTSLMLTAAFSPDGERVAYYGAATRRDLSVHIDDVETGDTVTTLTGHNSSVNSIAFSADGSKIVTGSDDATARVWDAETGEQLTRMANGGLGVKRVAISQDGRFVATAGNGLAVYSAETGRELMRVPGFESEVEFSPDDKLIAALGPGEARVSVIDCDVCVDDVDSLLALADERITREPSVAEREEFLDR